jgi:hypothetical protein
LLIEAAADMLDLLARTLPELAAGFTKPVDAAEVGRIQNSIGAAFARVDACQDWRKSKPITPAPPR